MNFEELNFVTYCVDNLSRRLDWSAVRLMPQSQKLYTNTDNQDISYICNLLGKM